VIGLNRDGRLMFAVNLSFSVGMGLYGFVMPAYVRQLGASPAQFGALISCAFALGTLSVIPGGPWADRFDRRALMIAGWLMCLPVPLIYAWAPTWPWLIPGYAIFFLSFFCNPALSAYVAAIAEPGRSGAVWGAINSAFPLGFIVGPPVGAAVIRSFGMQAVFYCTFACYLVSFLFVLMLAPQPGGRTSALLGASRPLPGPAETPGDAGHVRRSRRTAGALLTVAALFACFQLLAGVGGNYVSMYLVDTTGLDLGGVGFFGSAGAIGGFVCAPLIGRLRDRRGSRTALPAALGLVILSNAGLLLLRARAAVFGSLVLRGGENGVFTLGQAEMAAAARGQGLGRAFALYHVLGGIGGTIGPYLGGALYVLDRRLPFLFVALGSASMIVCSRILHGLAAARGSRLQSDPEGIPAPAETPTGARED
jgi:MFS family permease